MRIGEISCCRGALRCQSGSGGGLKGVAGGGRRLTAVPVRRHLRVELTELSRVTRLERGFEELIINMNIIECECI